MTEQETAELAACRWCQDDDAEVINVLAGRRKYSAKAVQCRTCGATGPVKDTESEAIAAWQTRTPSPTIAEAVLAEREACAEVVDERAEACRMAGVQGDIDPIEAQILDEHLSEAAAALRNRGGDDGEGVGKRNGQ